MDADVKKVLDMADELQRQLNALEKRRAFSLDRQNAIAAAANGFRFVKDVHLSNLRAAFDPEYAEELERLTRGIKGK